MHILTYDEIDRKKELIPLFFRSFGYPFDPQRFEQRRQRERELWGERSDAFCALVGDTIAGLVGVRELPTRTLGGDETVGWLWSVLTHPSFTRRGIAIALMERAHEHYEVRNTIRPQAYRSSSR